MSEIIKADGETYRIEDSIVRAFLLVGTKRALLVDSANGEGNVYELVKSVTDKPVTLINTHADEDHIGGNGAFSYTLMHPSEFAFYSCTKRPGDARPMPVCDGEVIDLGDREVEIILTPGHTPGSIALLDRRRRVLFPGDSVSTTPVFIFGEMRSLEALLLSLKRLKLRSGDFDAIYPSHGDFPVSKQQIDALISCGEMLRRKELQPLEPAFPVPAKMFEYGSAAFFAYE